jgi:hypothetical protein
MGIVLLGGKTKIGESYGVEVIVSQGNEAKSQAAKLDDFLDYNVRGALPRALSVGPPN